MRKGPGAKSRAGSAQKKKNGKWDLWQHDEFARYNHCLGGYREKGMNARNAVYLGQSLSNTSRNCLAKNLTNADHPSIIVSIWCVTDISAFCSWPLRATLSGTLYTHRLSLHYVSAIKIATMIEPTGVDTALQQKIFCHQRKQLPWMTEALLKEAFSNSSPAAKATGELTFLYH